MNVIEKISQDLRNPKCEGFFLESDGNEMTVRRINRWQFDITTESWRGHVNTYYKADASYVEKMAEELLAMDDRGCYIPHYPINKWPEAQVEKFMITLCPKLCDPFCKGFTLTAEDAEAFVVRKHPNGIEWHVDWKITDFCGVLRKTREKLAESHMWEFSVI